MATNGSTGRPTEGTATAWASTCADSTPAPVTPFNEDGSVDYDAIQRLGSWLGSFPDVKGLVVLGHAGEGTFLTPEEQVAVIKAFVKSVDGKIPIIAGITGEGTEVAAIEAKRAKDAGAAAGLLYPSHGWLRFGYQPGAPQDRYKRVVRAQRPASHPLPIPRQYQGDLQLADDARHFGPAGRIRHEERCAEHAQVGYRDSCHPKAAARAPDPHMPRRVSVAHRLRRGRDASRLRDHRTGALKRADPRWQGPGLSQGPCHPRYLAAGDQGGLSPWLAHGRHCCVETRLGGARDPEACDRPIALVAIGEGCRG